MTEISNQSNTPTPTPHVLYAPPASGRDSRQNKLVSQEARCHYPGRLMVDGLQAGQSKAEVAPQAHLVNTLLLQK